MLLIQANKHVNKSSSDGENVKTALDGDGEVDVENEESDDAESEGVSSAEQLLPSLFLGKLCVANSGNSAAGGPNKDVLNSISGRVTAVRQQYAKLTRLGRNLSCYSRQCSVNTAQFPGPSVSLTSSCYSPLCLQKARVRRELLILLRKVNNHSSNNNLLSAAVPAVKTFATTPLSQKVQNKDTPNTATEGMLSKHFQNSFFSLLLSCCSVMRYRTSIKHSVAIYTLYHHNKT
jgi:nucleosome-remodeling factor subunit BPTF